MSDANHQKILCIRVTGPQDAIRALLSLHPAEADAVSQKDRETSVELHYPEHVVDQIDRTHLKVEVLYDASARGRERQKEVGKGNRFEGDQRLFQGLGIKTKGEPR